METKDLQEKFKKILEDLNERTKKLQQMEVEFFDLNQKFQNERYALRRLQYALGETLSKIDPYHTLIEDFDLSVRAYNVLKGINVLTIGDLLQRTDDDLKLVHGMGKKTFREIKDLITKFTEDQNKNDLLA